MSSADVRSAAAAALATLLGACALTPVYSSLGWLLPVVSVVLVVLAGGLLLRVGGPALWARVGDGRPVPGRVAAVGVALVPVVQLLLVLCLLTARYAPDKARLGVIPTRRSLAGLMAVLTDGAGELREQATPALALTGLLAMTTVFVGVIAVVVDLVAVAGRQATLAGAALLALYCVPVVTITGGIGLVALVAPAVGLAVLLWSDQRRRVGSASRTPGPGLTARLGTGTVAALRIGAAALIAGLLVGAVVPTLAEGSLASGLDGGTGRGGGGGGSATGTSLDPFVELAGQLTLPKPIDLLRMDSSVDDPGYLRAVTLDVYDADSGWRLSTLTGQVPVAGNQRLAPLPPREQGRTVTARIQALRHDDRFLPVPASPLAVRMQGDRGGDWRFDPPTGTVFGRGVTSKGRSYNVVAVEPRPPSALLAAATPLPVTNRVQEQYTALPQLDPRILATVAQVTAGATTPYERVRSIHAFLTDRTNGFRYSLSTTPGTSGDRLVDFLTEKRGFCEQYAGTMAVMVRAAGIPARVALGYTPGEKQKDGSRLITSDDAHAWVEVYFQSLGWVPFDPTPISAARAVTLPWAPRADAPATHDSNVDAPAPAAPTTAPSAPVRDRGGDNAPVVAQGQTSGGTSGLLPAGIAIALLLLVAGTPGGARALRRRRRIAAGTAGALWDELTATALDVGAHLRPSWTPRRVASELGEVVRLGGDASGDAAADAVGRLARAEELACYGPAGDGVPDPDLAAALDSARRGLLRSASRGARLRALLWPASLLAEVRAGDGRRGLLARLHRPRTA